MRVSIEKGPALEQFAIRVPEAPALERDLNSEVFREALLIGLTSKFSELLSNYLLETLRGLSFVESAGEILKNSPLFSEGPLFQHGAISIELAAPHPRQKLLTLAFSPFKTPAAFVHPEGLELYFSANLFSADQVRVLTGTDPLHLPTSELKQKMTAILSNPTQQPEPQFDRVPPRSSKADFSLILPTSLIDEALTRLYQERLLAFRMKTDLGSQTRGLIAKEAQDVAMMITISPHTSPKIKFEANTLQLEVNEYMMDIGTWIEDRIIPSTQISNSIRIAASLKVDSSSKTVNLALKPNEFNVKIEDTKARLSEDDLSFLRRMANSTWRDFLNTYSEFVLFPTVINPRDFKIEILEISHQGPALVLDLRLFVGDS
jgi:hypothetical protein